MNATVYYERALSAILTEGYDNEMTRLSPATGVAARLRRRGVALEDAILEAAYTELSEVGYASFSVEGVAARARTGKASIYRRWPTRGDLIMDAVCSQLPMPADCGLDIADIPDEVSTADAFRAVARIITAVISSPAGDVVRAVKCEAVTDPELARAIDDRFQAPRREQLLRLLRRGVERGEVRPDAATSIVADVLPAVLTHRMIMQRETVTARDVEDIIEQVMLPLIAPR